MSTAAVFSVRPATRDDAPGIAQVCAATGQAGVGTGADPAYLDLLLDTGTVVVADGGDAVIGWGATRVLSLGTMLTDLFVAPQQHGHGAGGALVRTLWPDRRGAGRFTFSSQHANARALYVRAGLQPKWPLLYLAGPRAGLPASGYRVSPLGPEAAAAADRQLGGGDRRADYRYWAGRPGHRAVAVTSPAAVLAVGVLGVGEIVHLACAGAGQAIDCVLAALHAIPADSVRCCLPTRHPVTATLRAAGMRATDHDIAMATADCELPTAWVYSPGLA